MEQYEQVGLVYDCDHINGVARYVRDIKMCTMLRAFNGYCMRTQCDVLSFSALCAGQPSNLTISRIQNGSALTDPVVFGVNQTVSIWCRAENVEAKLLGLNWRYTNGTRLPKVERGETSVHDVYRERFAGNRTVYTPVWWTVLHFSRIQPSHAGVYYCVANYLWVFRNQSVAVQVLGG